MKELENNKKDISLIINCNKEDIENIDINYFKSQYSKVYFNVNNNLDKIIDIIETKYYSIWDYNKEYNNIYNLTIYYSTPQNIDISILIPVYNCEKYIKECLDSCLNQDFKGKYEIIIVDDGSEDNTIKLINEYKDSRIKLFQKKHSGISDTLNYGLRKCNGKYICRMDADDIMYEYRLSYQYLYMEQYKDCDILASNITRYELIDDNTIKLYDYSPNLEIIKKNISIDDLFNKYNNYNFICHSAICFRKSLYQNIMESESNFYNSEFDLAEDYELYCRLITKYNIVINTDNIIVLKYLVRKSSEEKQNIIHRLRNKLYFIYNINEFNKLTFGIYYIATGIYKNDFKQFLLSCKNFFPNNKKTIILLSDGLEEYNNYIDTENNINIIYKHIIDFPWPIITLFKMKYILDNIINTDYIFYFNANCEILPIKSYEWFDKDKLIFTYHKDWFNNNCDPSVFCEPYMDNPNSTSYIGTTDYIYIQGAFFGGPTQLIYKMCETINEMITIDLQNNIIPRYHDETYLNKYNYLYNNALISNILISEIWNNKNDLSNIQDTQFILMHENIYNLTQNNKTNKFEYIIPHHLLQPLYNYPDIYEYLDKYPSVKINKNYENNSIILFYIKTDITIENLTLIIKITKLLKPYYEFMVFFDSRLDKFLLEKLYTVYDSNHIYGIDIISYLDIYKNIKNDNLFFYAEQIINLLIINTYWNNFINKKDFKYLYIINDIQLFDDNIDNLLQINKDDDLLVYNYNIYNIYEFDNNEYTKKYNLFKYKYKFKYQVFSDLINCRISHNAFEFISEYRDSIKASIPQYYMPTLLYNNKYTISNF